MTAWPRSAAATVAFAGLIGAANGVRAACPELALASDTPVVQADGLRLSITVTNLKSDGAGPSHILVLLHCQGRYVRDLTSFASLAGTEPSAKEILKPDERKQFSVPTPYLALPHSCRVELVACVYPNRL